MLFDCAEKLNQYNFCRCYYDERVPQQLNVHGIYTTLLQALLQVLLQALYEAKGRSTYHSKPITFAQKESPCRIGFYLEHGQTNTNTVGPRTSQRISAVQLTELFSSQHLNHGVFSKASLFKLPTSYMVGNTLIVTVSQPYTQNSTSTQTKQSWQFSC